MWKEDRAGIPVYGDNGVLKLGDGCRVVDWA